MALDYSRKRKEKFDGATVGESAQAWLGGNHVAGTQYMLLEVPAAHSRAIIGESL
jgi:hypothetical protein